MRATIKDIAAATGFSVTTISLVLNGKGYKISDETKNQILAKARELNYRPNQLAVSLVKRQSKTIGFIVPDISNVYFANMARAIDEACRENGWSVILCNTNDNYDRDREYIDLLADKGADGIVFIMAKDNTREMAAEEIDYLESIHIPYVVVDRIPELRRLSGGAPSVKPWTPADCLRCGTACDPDGFGGPLPWLLPGDGGGGNSGG